ELETEFGSCNVLWVHRGDVAAMNHRTVDGCAGQHGAAAVGVAALGAEHASLGRGAVEFFLAAAGRAGLVARRLAGIAHVVADTAGTVAPVHAVAVRSAAAADDRADTGPAGSYGTQPEVRAHPGGWHAAQYAERPGAAVQRHGAYP